MTKVSREFSNNFGLSVSTDIKGGEGPADKRLIQIAESGFTHVLWCHYSGSQDYLYPDSEILKTKKVLQETGLQLLDLHAPSGKEWLWTSTNDYQRKQGVEMVKNRMRMASELGSQVVMNHWYAEPILDKPEEASAYWSSTLRTLDDLEKYSRQTGVKLALENMDVRVDNFPWIKKLLTMYGPDFLGVCYDSGHGNIQADGLAHLEDVEDRLISEHLSDNHGLNKTDSERGDTHRLPFDGTVNWDHLTTQLARSSYQGVVSLELIMRTYPDMTIEKFLAEAFKRGQELTKIIEIKKLIK